MAKAGKSSKSENGNGISQKHLHSRISYLYQAAVYLGTVELNVQKGASERTGINAEAQSTTAKGLACHSASTEKVASRAETSGRRLQSQRKVRSIEGSSSQTHHLLATMRSISQKSQIRLAQSIKRSVCRRCNELLTLNSSAQVENFSRGGKKPEADVLVVRCCRCGFAKRYPVGLEEAPGRKLEKRMACAVVAPSKDVEKDAKHAART